MSCHDVMARLTERGHHVEVLTSDHWHAGVDEPSPLSVAAVHRSLRLYFRDGQLWAPSLRERWSVERTNQRALRDAIASCRPDVVAVWHVGAMSLGLLTTVVRTGIPVVYAVSDDWPAYARNLDPWTRVWRRAGPLGGVGELLTRVPTTVPDLDPTGSWCFISEVTRARCRRSSPWSFPRSSVVGSGIDGRLFRLAEAPPGAAREGIELLYVGRIDERKGIRTILRALPHLPTARLVIDGHVEDADRDALRAWADEVGVTHRVTVQKSDRDDLPAVYAAADVCVFASEWEEPFGLVPLEAMACGTPVVATGVGGSGEFLVDGENAVLYRAGDPEALAGAVERLAGDAALRERLLANGLVTAERYDVEHLADAFEDEYVNAAAAGGRPRPPAGRGGRHRAS